MPSPATLPKTLDIPLLAPALPGARPYRWTLEQYHRMGEVAVFEPGTRVELLGGIVVEQDVRGERHSVPPAERPPGAWAYRWTRDEYDRVVAAGIFPPDAHAELLNGTVYEMSPQGSKHAATVSLLTEVLHRALETGYHLRVQSPLAVAGGAEPEPDVAVVEGGPADYSDAHPTTAALAVEISVTSLAVDRTIKLPIYAAAGVPEYWIVNVEERYVEVYREPSGATYGRKVTLRPGDILTPLAAPEASIPVADLFF